MAIESIHQLAATLRGRRMELGLTQAEAAERAGVSRDWINTFEAGKPRVELGLVLRLIDALGLRLDVIEATPDGAHNLILDTLFERYEQ